MTNQQQLQRTYQHLLAQSQPIRLIIGARETEQSGWISTNIDTLNLVRPSDWQACFTEDSIDSILAEHVWEHLNPEEAVQAAHTCYTYLKPGGYLRIAVPDGLHPSPPYLEWVKPNGVGPDAEDHKVMFTYKTLAVVFEQAGFEVQLLEYFDESGEFHHQPWEPDQGFIKRSRKFDPRNQIDQAESTDPVLCQWRNHLQAWPYPLDRHGQLNYTSIILDAWKPLNSSQ
jgi:predicted SAM-dependent methyltransferase